MVSYQHCCTYSIMFFCGCIFDNFLQFNIEQYPDSPLIPPAYLSCIEIKCPIDGEINLSGDLSNSRVIVFFLLNQYKSTNIRNIYFIFFFKWFFHGTLLRAMELVLWKTMEFVIWRTMELEWGNLQAVIRNLLHEDYACKSYHVWGPWNSSYEVAWN